MEKKSIPSPPAMPPTSVHYQTPVPGPTTAQMIEGNVYNIIVVLFDNIEIGLKCAWSVNFTWAHTLIPPNMSHAMSHSSSKYFWYLIKKSCLAVQLRLRLLDRYFIHTRQQEPHSPPTCSKWAKSTVKWARPGSNRQPRRRRSTSLPVRTGITGLK